MGSSKIIKAFLKKSYYCIVIMAIQTQRKIIHIDMDAFYASVEQRDFPEYRGKPVVVGSDSDRGVISAASYEARKFGVRSAMSSVVAKKLCPHLIFAHHRMSEYVAVSRQIMAIFLEITPLVEPLSIDEAFLDVTENSLGIDSAFEVAQYIRAKIKELTGLNASAGVSYNKFLAKKASDVNKPNGIFEITNESALDYLDKLTVENFFGVGEVTARKMHKLGVHTGKDIRNLTIDSAIRLFGKQGVFFFEISRGRDNRPVVPHRERKSIGAEYTFEKDLTTKFQIVAELYKIEKELMRRLDKKEMYGRTITLKIKFADFSVISRSKTDDKQILSFDSLHKIVKELLYNTEFQSQPIRLLGVSVSNFDSLEDNSPVQLELKLI